jgi:uncharacterized protein
MVIDHHITAAQELEGLLRNDGIVDGMFDMEKSGCLLTWEWFFKDRQPPPASLAINDRICESLNCRGPGKSS